MISKLLRALVRLLPFRRERLPSVAAFCGNRQGSVAILFALSVVMILCAVGAGLDLARAYQTRQKLAEVAMLACQYATRPTIDAPVAASTAGTLQQTDYVAAVTSFIQTSLTSQKLAQPQTNSAPFTYTAGGSGQVTLTATVPTLFMAIVHVSTIPVTASATCFTTLAQVNSSNSPYVLQESFETSTTGTVTWYLPSGTAMGYSNGSVTIPKTTTFNAANTYTGSSGIKWVVMGYCLETDHSGIISSTAPQGSYTAELDCDNGSGTAGDSSISTRQYLNAGEYELRYNFRSRVDYPDYDPTYICGSQLSDESWATDTYISGGLNVPGTLAANAKNNQIDVFLDADNNDTAPTHLINDGTMSLAGSNLIDSCVYSSNWVQRSVRVYVSTPGYYWLSFAADGTNNSFGGQIDNIMFCIATCPGSLQDNFPFTSNEVLFEDTFESPTYTGSPVNNNGNVNNSYGASYVWDEEGHGWAKAPINQTPYWLTGCPQGNQCVQLGWNNATSLMSRPILLDPGYYQINYDYLPEGSFAALSGAYCGATPTAARYATLAAASSDAKFRQISGGDMGTIPENDFTVGVFMSHAQEASTPNMGNALGSTTTYTNPDGTTSTTPTVAPNGISLTSYNSSQVNPLLDMCVYASTAQTRSAVVFIQKPAYYWLTLSGLGPNTGVGGEVDDVKITALQSPYYSTYASGAVTIPVPSPQPSAQVSYSGFYIVADPLTPPAP